MTGRYLLDTNVAIAILERDLESLRSGGREIFLNSTVPGELFFGAEKSQRLEENLARIRFLVSQHGLTLVTRDGHFEYIESLNSEAW